MAKRAGRTSGRRQTGQGEREPKEKGPGTTALATRERSTAVAPPSSPFARMHRLAAEMDRLFEDFRLGSSLPPRMDLPWESPAAADAAWMPSLEVTERGGRLVVRADLPGLTKNDVKVEVRDDALCISGERRQEREEKRKGLYRSERTYGRFYREVPLPDGVDPEQAKASFRNGVLEVTMPAPPRPAKGRQVPIEEA